MNNRNVGGETNSHAFEILLRWAWHQRAHCYQSRNACSNKLKADGESQKELLVTRKNANASMHLPLPSMIGRQEESFAEKMRYRNQAQKRHQMDR